MADAAARTEPCTHPNFAADVDVGRIEPDPVTGIPKAFVADITINCAPEPEGCGMPFVFPGLACGLSFDQPRISVDGTEMHAPLRPADAADGVSGLPSVALRIWQGSATEEPPPGFR